jgi:ABC-type sugar transport system substrate-binding protein
MRWRNRSTSPPRAGLERFAGVQETLRGSLIEMATLNADWTADGGARAMAEWVQTRVNLDPSRFLVGAQNDAMAMGARRALEEVAKAREGFPAGAIRVCGCDGSPRYGQRYVKEGKLTSTVVMPPVAGRAVDEVAAMTAAVAPPPVRVLLEPTSFPDLQTLAATAV